MRENLSQSLSIAIKSAPVPRCQTYLFRFPSIRDIIRESAHVQSNFRRLLDQFRESKSEITDKLIKNGLNKTEQEAWDEISDDLSVEEKAIRYWTSDHYDNIQNAIGQDNEQELVKYMPLILAITKYIGNNPLACQRNELIVCYRKSKLRGDQFRFFRRAGNGKVFLSLLFSATTLNINLLLAWQGNAIIKFIIDKENGGYKRARNISHLSQHRVEQEILLQPHTAMEFVAYQAFTLPRYIYCICTSYSSFSVFSVLVYVFGVYV